MTIVSEKSIALPFFPYKKHKADLNPIEYCSDYLKKESESSNWTMSGTFRMLSDESGKDSRWVISDIWWGLWGVGVMRSLRQTVGIHVIEPSKSVTVNDEFDTVCLFHWMVFNNEMKFLCLCTINLLEYNCLQMWVVNFSPKPHQPGRKWHQSQTCVFNGLKYIYILYVRQREWPNFHIILTKHLLIVADKNIKINLCTVFLTLSMVYKML